MDVISHPFRLDSTGKVATVVDGTTDAHAEAIAVTVLTKLGERALAPDFGITDPAFEGVNAGELAAAIDVFGPEGVSISSVSVTPPTGDLYPTRIEFEETDQ